MFKTIPPAGIKIKFEEIFSALNSSFFNRPGLESFKESLKKYFGVKHAFLVSSGRAALTIILRAINSVFEKKEVIIPAYTCFSVPSAIYRAGFKISLCDISLKTLSLDPEKLSAIVSDQTLCVVPVHMFGLSCEILPIIKIAHQKNCVVIEDAAQAMGGRLNDRKLGTFGDIGFFSLGRGKNITTFEGGIIITDKDEYAKSIQKEMEKLNKANQIDELRIFLYIVCYKLFLNPNFYWMADSLPFLELGVSKFDPCFSMKKLSGYQANLGELLLRRMDSINQERRKKALVWNEKIKDLEGLYRPVPLEGSYPVYTRFPVLLEKRDNQFTRQDSNRKLGMSGMYPQTVDKIEEVKSILINGEENFPDSEKAAKGLVTLPTHPYVDDKTTDKIVDILRRNV